MKEQPAVGAAGRQGSSGSNSADNKRLPPSAASALRKIQRRLYRALFLYETALYHYDKSGADRAWRIIEDAIACVRKAHAEIEKVAT